MSERENVMKRIKKVSVFMGMLALVFVLSALPKMESRAESMLGASLKVYNSSGQDVTGGDDYLIDETNHLLRVYGDGMTIVGDLSVHEELRIYRANNCPVSKLTLKNVNIGYDGYALEIPVTEDQENFILNFEDNNILKGSCLFYSTEDESKKTVTVTAENTGRITFEPDTELGELNLFCSGNGEGDSSVGITLSGNLTVYTGAGCDNVIYFNEKAGEVNIGGNVKLLGLAAYTVINSVGNVNVYGNAIINVNTGCYIIISSGNITLSDKASVKGECKGYGIFAFSYGGTNTVTIEKEASIDIICNPPKGSEDEKCFGINGVNVIVDTSGVVQIETAGVNEAIIVNGDSSILNGTIYLKSTVEEGTYLFWKEGVTELGQNMGVFGSDSIDTPYDEVNDKAELKLSPYPDYYTFYVNDKVAKTLVFTNVYNLFFNTNGAAPIAGYTVRSDIDPVLPKDPVRENYTFGGWFTDSALTQKFDAAKKLTKDTVLYAKWIINQTDNTITAKDIFKDYSTKKQTVKLNAKVNGGAKLTYTSNNKKVKVDGSGKVTIPAKFVGTVKLTIKSAETDKYRAATKTVTLTVTSSKTKFTKATALKKSSKLTWKKISNADGYEITYANNKDFKKAKKVTVKKTLTSTTIKKLTSKKTYYFKIRTYKKSGSKKIYSDYSAVKKVKIK